LKATSRAGRPPSAATRTILSSIEAEFRRYQALGDAAMGQLGDAELVAAGPHGANSIAIIARHIGGNLASRFTDFLTSDGEKPWRKRDEEFEPRNAARAEIVAHWEKGWQILFASLSDLSDSDLDRSVVIRGQELAIHDALHRALAHVSYHVGQIVYVAKAMKGSDWRYLSIPPGQSEAYNRNPTRERAESHAAHLPAGAPPADSVTVRQARLGDEAVIRHVRLAALADSPIAFESTLEREQNRTDADWSRWITRGTVFVLERAGEPMGLVAAVPHDSDNASVFLVSMWVHPELRGARAADQLVAAVIAWAKTSGAAQVLLHVTEPNVRARRFYERTGFRATGLDFIRKRDGLAEIEMAYSLAGPPGA
jgi:GNAT superfamily N-acetyltransferase